MIPHFLSHTNLTDIRLYILLGAAALYGTLGSPTPDNPGMVEIVIALLLLFAIGHKNLLNLVSLRTPCPTYITTGKILALYALIVGLALAAINGNQISQIMRDIIPFGFVLLPLLLADLTKHENGGKILQFGAIIIGLLFSIRALLNPLEIGAIATSQTGELLYLANMPTILFSAIMLTAFAGQKLLEQFTIRNIMLSLCALTLSLLPIMAMLISLQRASIGAFIIAILILLALTIIKQPKKSLRLLLPLGVAALYAAPFLAFYTGIIVGKTASVGDNMRFAELEAIWRAISTSPLNIFLGNGWGATFLSPAVGNIEINFSHSLLSSTMLKLGLLGTLIICSYLWTLAQRGWPLFHKNPVLALAILFPILIDSFLYASFKSFDFGLILCLIPAAITARKV